MKLNAILKPIFEDRASAIAYNMDTSLMAAAKSDPKASKIKTSKELVELLKVADPTSKGKMLQFIARMYRDKQFRVEDINRVKKDLQTFLTVQSRLKNKDINSYNSLRELYAALREVETEAPVQSNREIKKEQRTEGVDVLFQDSTVKVLKVKTEQAACLYGKGTRWCTAGDDDNQFEYYNESGPLFIILAKIGGNDRKFQFHLEDDGYDMFMDEEDQEVDDSDLTILSSSQAYTDFIDYLIELRYPNEVAEFNAKQ